MARRSSTPQSVPDRRFTAGDLKLALRRLDKLVAEVEQYDPARNGENVDHIRQSLSVKIEDTLASVLGQDTPRYNRFLHARDLYESDGIIAVSAYDDDDSRWERDQQSACQKGKDGTLSLLRELRGILNDEFEVLSPDLASGAPEILSASAIVGFEIITQRGRLDLADPPTESPYKLNTLARDNRNQFESIKTQLTELTEAVRGDNSTLGDTLKQQMIALLRSTLAELEAPYTDASRVKGAIGTFGNFVGEAVKRSISTAISSKVQTLIAALESWIKTLT